MPIVSDKGDRMDFGFPAPPQGSDHMNNGDTSWTPPIETHFDNSLNDLYFTHKSRPKDPATDKVVQHTIQRLSAELKTRPGSLDSPSSCSTVSTIEGYNTPPTPTTPPSFDLPAPKSTPLLTPFPSIRQHEQQYSPQMQPKTTTNRKLAMVRRPQYRGSNLRKEVRFDAMSPKLPHSVNTADFSFHGRSPCPSPWPSSGSHQCTLGLSCEDDACDHTRLEETQKSYYPSLATQACIRVPGQAPRNQREAEWNYRFPSSEALKHRGAPCASPVCSAPGSAYTSPITTPSGTPPDTPSATPPASKPTSLRTLRRRGGIFDDTNIDTDSNGSADSINSLITRSGSIRPQGLRNTPSQLQIRSKTSLPFWRRRSADKAMAKDNIQREKVNEASFSSCPSSIDANSQTAACGSHCTIFRKLKRVIWREKVETKEDRSSA